MGVERCGIGYGGVGERVADGGKQFRAVYLVTKDLAKRDGVRGIADKLCLVDIEPYADEGA